MMLLNDPCLFNHDIRILSIARQDEVMRNESGSVFIDHHQTTKLVWLSLLTTPVELCVSLKQAEKLV